MFVGDRNNLCFQIIQAEYPCMLPVELHRGGLWCMNTLYIHRPTTKTNMIHQYNILLLHQQISSKLLD